MAKPKNRFWDIKLLAALCLFFLCCAGLFLSYDRLYRDTPDYAASRLVAAIRENDPDRAAAYMNGESLTAQFFDALTSEYQGTAEPSAAARLIWLPLRTDFIATGRQWIKNETAGRTDDQDALAVSQKMTGQMRELNLPVPLTNWHCTAMSFSRPLTETTAEITFTLHNDALDQDILCPTIWKRNDLHRWQLQEFSDAPLLVRDLRRAYRTALATYNEDQQRQIDKLAGAEVTAAALIRQDDKKAPTFLRIQYVAHFPSGTAALSNVRAVYTLRRSNDDAILYRTEMHLSAADPEQPHTSQFLLSPLATAQFYPLGQMVISDTTSTISVISVRLKDGTVLAKETRLPVEL